MIKGLSDRQNVEMMRTDWALGNGVNVDELLDMADRLIEEKGQAGKLESDLYCTRCKVDDMVSELDAVVGLMEEIELDGWEARESTLRRIMRIVRRARLRGKDS